MKTLAAPKSLPNFTRWEVDDWEAHEKAGYGVALIILRTGSPTNYTITKQIWVRNATPDGAGRTDKIGYVATVGGPIAEQLVVTEGAIASATAFDEAHAAYLSGTPNRAARLDALASHMLAAGIADATLAGS
jgi:hypothetical protein